MVMYDVIDDHTTKSDDSEYDPIKTIGALLHSLVIEKYKELLIDKSSRDIDLDVANIAYRLPHNTSILDDEVIEKTISEYSKIYIED